MDSLVCMVSQVIYVTVIAIMINTTYTGASLINSYVCAILFQILKKLPQCYDQFQTTYAYLFIRIHRDIDISIDDMHKSYKYGQPDISN